MQGLLVSYAPTKGAYCSTLLIEDFNSIDYGAKRKEQLARVPCKV